MENIPSKTNGSGYVGEDGLQMIAMENGNRNINKRTTKPAHQTTAAKAL